MAEMQPTIKILESIKQNSGKNRDEVFTRLYRYMHRPDLYFVAYQNLYANQGAATKGVNSDTADGFGEEKIIKLIQSLADETYSPKPARRTYVKKSNGKMRPLGIPTFTDKLVQEVLRMILEAVYEPIFSNNSHGFRPNRSCHTALKSLRKEFTGVRWFVEGDIKGCFDNIDHHILVNIISSKIKDARLIKLIWKMLKAGYMEDWKYHNTYSGTPQGGIVSPIFSNIYLNELDKFALKLAVDFNRPREQKLTDDYHILNKALGRVSYHLRNTKGEEKTLLLRQKKELENQMRKTPRLSQTDKVLKYIRYADDFIIGVKGDRTDCIWIKNQFADFISQNLNMELSEEKTLITHSSEHARFLSYDIRVRRNGEVRRRKDGVLQRSLNNTVELNIPFADKIMPFLFSKSVIEQKNGQIRPKARPNLLHCTELEILTTFNAELRGKCNYYAIASNFSRLNYFAYLMEYSCLKTIARKRSRSVKKILRKYRNGQNRWRIPYETKQGQKFMTFANFSDCRKVGNFSDTICNASAMVQTTTTLEKRLAAKQCELCGATDVALEIHHINKVKNLKGKVEWERLMIAKKRKTLAVCVSCHDKIHYPEGV